MFDPERLKEDLSSAAATIHRLRLRRGGRLGCKYSRTQQHPEFIATDPFLSNFALLEAEDDDCVPGDRLAAMSLVPIRNR